MRRRRNKKLVIIKNIIFIALVVVAIVYFTQKEWVTSDGMEGKFSSDTYLDGGSGKAWYGDDYRIYYSVAVKSGGMYYELLTLGKDRVYYQEFTESCDGYIYISDIGEGTYIEHSAALSGDSVVYLKFEVQYERTKWESLWHDVYMLTGINIFYKEK